MHFINDLSDLLDMSEQLTADYRTAQLLFAVAVVIVIDCYRLLCYAAATSGTVKTAKEAREEMRLGKC